jgi:diguanylate cyclase (GGDEF)-like protein/PAS domain S-box-containing protein
MSEEDVNFEDLIRAVCGDHATKPSELDARRQVRRYERIRLDLANRGEDPTRGIDTRDPLRLVDDENARMVWQAEIAGLGTFIWTAQTNALVCSRQMAEMLGYPPKLLRDTADLYFQLIYPDDSRQFRRAFANAWEQKIQSRLNHRIVRADGEIRHLQCTVEVLATGSDVPVGLIGTVQDVTEAVQSERALDRARRQLETMYATVGENLADRDPHTRLFNRRRFVAELQHAQRRGNGAVLLIGVGGLGDINVEHGPEAGDDVVLTVAQMLQEVITPPELVARIGGAEFAVLLGGRGVAETTAIAHNFLRVLQTPMIAAARNQLTTCVGLVNFSDYGSPTAEDILMDADQALYDAKQSGRDVVVAPEPCTVSATSRRRRWQTRIETAMRQDLFDLHEEPILDLATNVVSRHELLLRLWEWNEPMTPSSFLPTAERLGAIVDIDRYVIERAIELVANDRSDRNFHVNLSGSSICEPGLPEFVRGLIHDHRADARRLTFEVTETAFIGSMSAAREFGDVLRSMGCQLALDDFGSGFASLTHLKHLPFDIVKIDGDFITRIRENAVDQIMVRSLADMCSQLGIITIAEYVPDESTLALLRACGIDMAQGDAVGRSVPTRQVGTRGIRHIRTFDHPEPGAML